MLVNKTCEICGKPFRVKGKRNKHAYMTAIRQRHSKTCSKKCSSIRTKLVQRHRYNYLIALKSSQFVYSNKFHTLGICIDLERPEPREVSLIPHTLASLSTPDRLCSISELARGSGGVSSHLITPSKFYNQRKGGINNDHKLN